MQIIRQLETNYKQKIQVLKQGYRQENYTKIEYKKKIRDAKLAYTGRK